MLLSRLDAAVQLLAVANRGLEPENRLHSRASLRSSARSASNVSRRA